MKTEGEHGQGRSFANTLGFEIGRWFVLGAVLGFMGASWDTIIVVVGVVIAFDIIAPGVFGRSR